MTRTSEEDRVRDLVRRGKLAGDEGERLLAALSERHEKHPALLLVDPFDKFGGFTGVALGVLAAAAGIALSRLNLRFDGFLDMHILKNASPSKALLDAVVYWPLPSLLFWATARTLKRGARFIDVLAAFGLARIPLVLAAPLCWALTPRLVPVAAVALIAVAWNITLLYRGYKHASGLQDGKLVGSFVALIVLSEVVSKIIV